MKVNYYFRSRASGNFSIENVFDTVAGHLPPDVAVVKHFARKPFDLLFLLKAPGLKADIHHITGAIGYLALTLSSKNTVLTVHDLGHYIHTLTGFKKIVYKYLFLEWPLKKVRHVTAISEFTKRQIMDNFKIRENRISVIPNPVNPLFQKQERNGNKIPVVLQIGSGQNKNIERLVEAVKGLNVKLLLVRRASPAILELLRENRIDFEIRTDLTNEQLLQAYKECDMVYFASTYEGFGLPIIEGMACGRPVVTSNMEPMKEVAGGAACLVNPLEVNEIRNALLELINDPDYYSRIQVAGTKRAEAFSAGRIADQYFQLYKSLIVAN